MPKVALPIVMGGSPAPSSFVSSRTLVNCFMEFNGGRPALYGGPGLTSLATLSQSPVRGIRRFGELVFAVGGNRLNSVSQLGAVTDIGEIAGSDRVVMADNGTQLMIVADTLSYVWDGATLAQITDPDFSVASSVDFLDQYMITSVSGTGRFQISALADATSYDALDIATAETRPDLLRRVFVDNRDLLLMGTETIEGQYNSGAADFPFERSQLFFELGLRGRDCVAAVDNSVAFLASDGTVRIIRGGTPVIISTPAIASTIDSWGDPGAAVAFSFSMRNHQFWALRHRLGCVIWDASAPPDNAWTVRKSYGSDTWRIGHAAPMLSWNDVVLADADGANLYTMDPAVHAEGSTDLVRELVSEAMGPNGQYFTLNAVELLIEPGVGVLSGQGSDPEVWLQLSRNSGKTYGARMTRKIGARGDYERRIVWGGGFGQFRPEGGVIKLGCSDPVAFVIKGAWADYTVDAA